MSNTFKSHVLIIFISAIFAILIAGLILEANGTEFTVDSVLPYIPKLSIADSEIVTVTETPIPTADKYNDIESRTVTQYWVNTSSDTPTNWNWSYTNLSGSTDWTNINTSPPNRTLTFFDIRSSVIEEDAKSDMMYASIGGISSNKTYYYIVAGGGGAAGGIYADAHDIDRVGGGGAGGVVYINYYNYSRGNV